MVRDGKELESPVIEELLIKGYDDRCCASVEWILGWLTDIFIAAVSIPDNNGTLSLLGLSFSAV